MRALAAAVVAAVAVSLAPSAANAGTVTRATGDARGCHEPMAFVRVPATAVRKHVPSRYRLYEDLPGQATLFVRGAWCKGWNVGGKEIPTFIAQVGALVRSPDGGGCMTHGMRDYGADQLDGNAIELCNYYSFFVATDNRRYVRWLRAGGLERFPVHYTRKFKFSMEPGRVAGEFAFDFSVGGAVPWPFRLRGTGHAREGALPMTISVWNDVGGKTVKFTAEPDVLLGHAEGKISTPARTGLAKVLGGTSMSFAGPWSLNYILQVKLIKEVRRR